MRPFYWYLAGFFVAVGLGFYMNSYIGFIAYGLVYAIIVGIISAVFNINPIEKSVFDRRKKENNA